MPNHCYNSCLLYTSDAADDMQCVDLGESIYGNYPVQDPEGQYSLKKGESIVI